MKEDKKGIVKAIEDKKGIIKAIEVFFTEQPERTINSIFFSSIGKQNLNYDMVDNILVVEQTFTNNRVVERFFPMIHVKTFYVETEVIKE